jgi:hypothetical protein
MKLETGKKNSQGGTQNFGIEGKPSCDQQAIVDAFYNYFLHQHTQLPNKIHIITCGLTKILLLLLFFITNLGKKSLCVLALKPVSTTENINTI